MLHSSLDAANLLRRQAAIQRGLEAVLIEAWCRWCLVSAGIITLLFLAAALGWRSLRPAA